ncbi:GNAT family N-acetyltransferase [Paenibacillus eucommiae]|uniref:RimJ/RimL family protein N-acetyltransferase n=1 Tax=Paenibacillus eucommiae TaxID=1355755 RepID=A0ABS4ISP7_9BACL|nr:GNAT family N-acetyltransferase [Paenibacillus eucommiae]MBP1990604.1 RimJ/RimL family protein N-acetyltransferase [Paenibacillus eucommiae]
MYNDFFNTPIVLENARVQLIPFSESSKEGLRSIIFDEEITQFTKNHIKSEADFNQYFDKVLVSKQLNQSYPFIVIDKHTGEVAGSTRYGNIGFENKRLEIGWTWYGRSFRGTGINKACKFELLKYAFEVMKFKRVQFSVDAENIRSQKAVLNLGAKQEGLFRSNYLDADGQSRDDIYYSIIAAEWDGIKGALSWELDLF